MEKQPPALIAIAGRDEAGMEAVADPSPAGPTAGELARPHDVVELRSPVSLHTVVALRHLQIVQIEARAEMRARGGVDDPRRRRRKQAGAQTLRQHVIGPVVDGEKLLAAGGGGLAGGGKRPGAS